MPITLVAAVASNGVIGRDGGIPWHLPEDLAHFQALTLGHVLVMGRRTFESIGRPLPGRTTIVVTRQREWSAEGVLVSHSVEAALELARSIDDRIFVVGGRDVYGDALPHATDLVLSEVKDSPEGDTYFPEFDRTQWLEVNRQPGNGFDVVHLRRVTD
jgi:dihydrofolate reductase